MDVTSDIATPCPNCTFVVGLDSRNLSTSPVTGLPESEFDCPRCGFHSLITLMPKSNTAFPDQPAGGRVSSYPTARSRIRASAARSQDVIKQLPCPRCGAPPRRNCRTPGGWRTHTHLERRSAAQDAGLWNPDRGGTDDRV